MPTHTLKEPGGLTFYYHDTDAPLKETNEYNALIMLHGITFNANVFERLFPLAHDKKIRIIAINRRPYFGSTEYSEAELHTIRQGTSDEKFKFWESQGRHLAQLISELIGVLDLGKVSLIGWSLGSAFVLFILNACSKLDRESRERLVEHVYSVVLWDPPSTIFGLNDPPNAYLPFYDTSIAHEDRPRRFREYVSSYFTHKDTTSDSTDVEFEHSLSYQPDTDKGPSVDNMSEDELRRIVDTSSPASGDIGVGELGRFEDGKALLQDNVRNALLHPVTRDLWGKATFSYIYGDRTAWYVPVAVRGLQKLLNEANNPRNLRVSFRVIKGANHMVMWDNPELAMQSLVESS